MTKRLLVTGSRYWDDIATIELALQYFRSLWGDDMVVVHGHCPTGADAIADVAARRMGIEVERHPADWDKHGKAAGPIRNREMCELGADMCIAFPKGSSVGTRGCMELAEAHGIEVITTEGT